MRSDALLAGAQGLALAIALALAITWPRAGSPALLVPLGPDGWSRALAWAAREDATILALDERDHRIVVQLEEASSIVTAIGAGLIPLIADAEACRPSTSRDLRKEAAS